MLALTFLALSLIMFFLHAQNRPQGKTGVHIDLYFVFMIVFFILALFAMNHGKSELD